MICEKFNYNGLQEKNWNVKITGLQIINGGQTCKTIYQTLKEHTEIDFSQVYILVRLYEVSDDEDVVQDITYATNSQNPVDFRDLKSNDRIQKLLEQGAGDLGYVYKRKRDNLGNASVIPSTVAAEAVFAVWRGKPHLAKYRRNEFFDKYYMEIFENLNAAQMVIAVLIFRYCDSQRKRTQEDPQIQAQRPFSQYFLAYMMGRRLLETCQISLEQLTHVRFEAVKECFEEKKEIFYEEEERHLVNILKEYFNRDDLAQIDGRTMAAAFRRFDILISYLNH